MPNKNETIFTKSYRDLASFPSTLLHVEALNPEMSNEDFLNYIQNPVNLTQSLNLSPQNVGEREKALIVKRLMDCINDENDQLKKHALALFLVRYFQKLNSRGWLPGYGDQDDYRAILGFLIGNNVKNEVTQLFPDEFDMVLQEGMRVGLGTAYRRYILETLSGIYEYDIDNAALNGKRAAARFAKLKKAEFLSEITSVLDKLENNEKQKEANYLKALSVLSQPDFMKVYEDPTQALKDAFAGVMTKIADEDAVQMAEDLNYNKIYFMLAQYHAEKAIALIAADSGDTLEIKAEMDLAEKYFNVLRKMPSMVDKINNYTSSPEYGDVFDRLGTSKTVEVLDPATKQAYIDLGIAYGNARCLEVFLMRFIAANDIAGFKAALNKFSADHGFSKLSPILHAITRGQLKYITEEYKQAAREVFEEVDKRQAVDLPEILKIDTIKMGGLDKNIDHQGNNLHIASNGASIYMVVTKDGKTGQKPDFEDDGKPHNDEFKFYVAFDPYRSESYSRCWEVLLKEVLGESNVYGVKMINPAEASKNYYDFNNRRPYDRDVKAQPGKMAVIYFKQYEKLKEERGEAYTRDMFYLENLKLVMAFNKALKEAGIQNDPNAVVPDHSLPLQGLNNPLIFVSGRETDENGKYVLSEERPENTVEGNPYTNRAIMNQLGNINELAEEYSARSASSTTSHEDYATPATSRDTLVRRRDMSLMPSLYEVMDKPSASASDSETVSREEVPLHERPPIVPMIEPSRQEDVRAAGLVSDIDRASDVNSQREEVPVAERPVIRPTAEGAQNAVSGGAVRQPVPVAERPPIVPPVEKTSFRQRLSSYFKDHPVRAAFAVVGVVLGLGAVTALSVLTAGATIPLTLGVIFGMAGGGLLTMIGAGEMYIGTSRGAEAEKQKAATAPVVGGDTARIMSAPKGKDGRNRGNSVSPSITKASIFTQLKNKMTGAQPSLLVEAIEDKGNSEPNPSKSRRKST